MTDINTALAASKDAIEQLMTAGERTATAWTTLRAGDSCTSRHLASAQPPPSECGCLAASGSLRRERRQTHLAEAGRRELPSRATAARFDKRLEQRLDLAFTRVPASAA